MLRAKKMRAGHGCILVVNHTVIVVLTHAVSGAQRVHRPGSTSESKGGVRHCLTTHSDQSEKQNALRRVDPGRNSPRDSEYQIFRNSIDEIFSYRA
jgi:hypothetical protein